MKSRSVDADGQPVPTRFYVDMYGSPGPDEVTPTLDAIEARLLEQGIVANLFNQPASEEAEAESLMLFFTVFNMASAVMAGVGAVGLLTALSMAVYERQKEIGVMRSIGARSRTIVSQFLLEGIAIGLIAYLVAVPLSYPFGWVLNDSLGFEGVVFEYPPVVLMYGLAGVLILATVASIWPSLGAARRTVSDILRYQ